MARQFVTVMTGDASHSRLAANCLAKAPIYSTPFPAQGNQRRYVLELVEVLQNLQEAGILPMGKSAREKQVQPARPAD